LNRAAARNRAGARLGRRGTLFVVSAPSGAGKTTLCREARLCIPDLAYSVSATTRAPRPGEVNGVDFRFVTEREFRTMLECGELAEWATVHGNMYGTPARPLEAALADGKDVLLDIDTQGAAQLAVSGGGARVHRGSLDGRAGAAPARARRRRGG
jgi:guanylate kinase